MTAHAFAKPRFGDPERIAERRRGMAVLDEVMLGFLARRISGKAPRLPKPGEVSRPPRHDLVHIGLVAGVPDDRILWTVEDPMQREGQLDHAKVRRKMTAGSGCLLDQELSLIH